jgi:hypothetical protein
MPMREGGERIAFGHQRIPTFCSIFDVDFSKPDGGIEPAGSRKRKRPQETPGAASSRAVTLRGAWLSRSALGSCLRVDRGG